MILQRIRIIVVDAGFEPGTTAPEVWRATNESPHLQPMSHHIYCTELYIMAYSLLVLRILEKGMGEGISEVINEAQPPHIFFMMNKMHTNLYELY